MTGEKRIVQLCVVRKRTGQRVVVEMEGGETFEIAPELVVSRGIKSGATLRDDIVEELQREDERIRARQRLTGYLALRVKSVADARLYLERAGFSDAAIAAAIAYAIERDLLDDCRFAERYVRTKIKTATAGPLRLVAELISHGIEQPLAESVVETEFDRDRQIEIAEKVATKRIKKGFGNTDKDKVEIVYDLLMQRGFDKEVAAEVAERVTGCA
jgi:regulatory protein